MTEWLADQADLLILLAWVFLPWWFYEFRPNT